MRTVQPFEKVQDANTAYIQKPDKTNGETTATTTTNRDWNKLKGRGERGEEFIEIKAV